MSGVLKDFRRAGLVGQYLPKDMVFRVSEDLRMRRRWDLHLVAAGRDAHPDGEGIDDGLLS